MTDLHVLLTAAPLLPTLAELLTVPRLIHPLLECWAFSRRGKARGWQEAEECLVALLRGAEEKAHVLLVDGYLHLLGLEDGGGEEEGERRLAFVAGGAGGVARRWVAADAAAETEGGGGGILGELEVRKKRAHM